MMGDGALVLTHDMIVEDVHYLPADPPEDVAWKLVAVNLSDLAAKGARPMGVLLGYTLGESEWDRAFAKGLGTALSTFGISLLGGDTVAMPEGAPRALGLTAIGKADRAPPSRAGALPGHHLWVSGTIGDAGAGLAALRAGRHGPAFLIERYRTPRPRLEPGERLATSVSAMMDVSDGLLVDAGRMAAASGCAAVIDLAAIPLSADYIEAEGQDRAARLRAATAGDDYELLFAAPPEAAPAIHDLADTLGIGLSRIGAFEVGEELRLEQAGTPVPLPDRLGFEHG